MYRFSRSDASVADALRRIALEQIGKARATIDDAGDDPDEAVHDVRKRCKKVRGLLRLVRPMFADYGDENAAFRDTARVVAPFRDAAVLFATYDEVVERYDEQADRRALASIRRGFTLRRRELVDAAPVAEALAHCRARLADAAVRVEGWRLEEDGFAALAGGLRKTYRRARNAMRDAEENPSPERFHAWRKRCKYNWYHARLLRPIWAGPMAAHADAADELGDVLGEHHDLAVFLEAMAEKPRRFGSAADLEAMTALVRSRQDALAAKALHQGTCLFAESPRCLVASWGRRHAAWRKGRPARIAALDHAGR